MSGAMPQALADAAKGHALRAEANAQGVSIGNLIKARFIAGLKPKAENDSLPGKTWRGMSLATRTVLVMLSASTTGDPREAARLPWESFSDGDKARMGACARELKAGLTDAACLF